MKKLLFTLVVYLLSFSCLSAESSSDYYSKKPKGFHWYDAEKAKKEAERKKLLEEKAKTESADSKDSTNEVESIVINSAWIKENLPKLQIKAQDNPTDENLANFFYTQRLALDISSRFSTRTREFFLKEPALSEDARRPTNASTLLTRKQEVLTSKEQVVKSLSDRFGLFFFYRSDCPYCHNQSRAMWMMQEQLGLEVLGISMDGEVLQAPKSNKYKHRYDDNLILSQKYDVKVTPTILLVDKKNQEAYPMAFGQTAYSEMMDRTIRIAGEMSLVDEKELNLARDVKEIIALDDSEEGVVLNKKEFKKNPSLLADTLRKRLISQIKD